MISQTKSLKIKSFLSFNFAITKICVAIHLAEDGTRMGGIKFQLSSSNISLDVCFMMKISCLREKAVIEKSSQSVLHNKTINKI